MISCDRIEIFEWSRHDYAILETSSVFPRFKEECREWKGENSSPSSGRREDVSAFGREHL